MKITKKSLIYDISNMAYVVADFDPANHSLHRVRDICQDGNIDRVARVLGLCYSKVISLLFPVLQPPRCDENRDCLAEPHDFEFIFRKEGSLRFLLTKEIKLNIRETIREYMVTSVLADWLGITLPEAADVWKFKAETAFSSLQEIIAEVSYKGQGGFRRRVPPM